MRLYHESQTSTRADGAPNEVDNQCIQSMLEEIAKLKKKVAQTDGKILGKVQLEHFDSAAKPLTKMQAKDKWPKWRTNIFTLRELALSDQEKYLHLRDRGGPLVSEVDQHNELPKNVIITDDSKFEGLVAKLEHYLRKDPSEYVAALNEFNMLNQGYDETVDDYVEKLNMAVNRCDMDNNARDAALRTRFIAGCKYKTLIYHASNQQDLSDMTFESLVRRARTEEKGKAEEKKLQNQMLQRPNQFATIPVFDVQSSMRAPSQQIYQGYSQAPLHRYQPQAMPAQQPAISNRRQQSYQRPYQTQKKSCVGCGGEWHQERRDCPVFLTNCAHCGKQGHIVQVCRARAKGIPAAAMDNQNMRQVEEIRNLHTQEMDAQPTEGMPSSQV